MKMTQINPKPLLLLLTPILAVLIIGLTAATGTHIAKGEKRLTDSVDPKQRARQVLLSQQLCRVYFSSHKKQLAKGQSVKVNFRYELRDVFMIVYYSTDTTYTEMNWTRCPNDNCPVTTVFNYGTPGYKQLGALAAKVKVASARKKTPLKNAVDTAVANLASEFSQLHK